jgi:diguanylate cyclase (GGDEF)-like protein
MINELEGIGDHSQEILSHQKENYLFDYRIGQRSMSVFSHYYPELNWYLVIEQDQTLELADVRKTLAWNVTLYVLITIVIGSLVVFTVNLFQSKMEAMAVVDELTGLFNRRRFYNLFQREIAYAQRYDQPLSLLMIDIDFFKTVNDQYGHPAGDRVIRKLADVMRQEVRAVDVVGRWGGEEFVILLHKTDTQQAYDTAERLREAIAQTQIDIGKKTIQATVSLGVASAPSGNLDMDEMIKQSDQAMYCAKQTGRNRTCILPAPSISEETGSTESKSTPPPDPKAGW